jgi:CRISPR-associated protein Cmr1
LGLGGGKPLFQEGINLRAPGGNTGWYFYPPFVDTGSPIAGRLTNLRDVNAVNDLSIVMRLISAWGGLGAKTQHGFGVVDMGIKDDELGEVTPRVEEFLARFSDGDGEDDHLPSLGNMFFGRLYLREGVPDNWWERAVLGAGANDPLGVEKWRLRKHWIVQEPFSVPSAPAIKYKLRYGWQPPGGAARTHPAPEAGKNAQLFFGQAGSSNRKSMINVSNTFKKDGIWQFRVWGWLPVGLSPIDRDKLMAELSRLITDVSSTAFWDSIFGAGIVDLGKSEWREIDATGHARNRPSASPPANCRDFLRTLLS